MESFNNEYKCLDCKHCFKKNPAFSLLDEDDLARLDNARIEVSFKAGEIIYKQGTPLTHIVILNAGFGKIYLDGPNDRNLILNYTKPFAMNGGIGIFIDERHLSSLRAVTDCEACFIEIREFKTTLRNNPEFMDAYLREHSLNILHTYHQLSILTQKNMEGRMAESLLYLDDNGFGNGSFKYIPKQDLAEFTAMTKESSIRVLKQFKDEGIIGIDNKIISILDKKALKQIAIHG
jgi:CRP-like cAMP-binding protein